MYLFCQKKYPYSRIYVNHRKHIDVCRKEKCDYLIDGESPTCKCPTNLQANPKQYLKEMKGGEENGT